MPPEQQLYTNLLFFWKILINGCMQLSAKLRNELASLCTDSKASDFKSVLRSGWVQNKMKSRFLGCTTFWARQKCVQLQKRLTSTVIEYILSNFWSFQLFALRHNIMLQKTSLSCLFVCLSVLWQSGVDGWWCCWTNGFRFEPLWSQFPFPFTSETFRKNQPCGAFYHNEAVKENYMDRLPSRTK